MKKHPDLEITSGLVEIPIKRLNIRYIPVVTPIEMWNYDMSLKNSPHVELLETIKRYKFDWDILKETRYWKERKHRYDIGFKDWDKRKIKNHIKRRWAIYNSLRISGFRPKLRGEKPIVVLKEPFWKTRFGVDNEWLKGFEIHDGGGACMAAKFLGWSTIPGYYAKDKCPGSKKKGVFEHKLRFVEDRWKEIF
ncbi:MAG: hypothetical protein GY853_14200 [PVC group bacterium]|nr:hypothetical protein [PVC group bacterium]